MIDLLMQRRFEALIRERGGLSLREQEAPALLKTLRQRMLALRLFSPQIYLELLGRSGAEAEAEWKQLWVLLTNQESYFFRDAEQLGVISRQILPRLIERRRDTRALRLWSAGCSTGEEPYTLAMMLEETPALRDWNISITATDISEAALARARRGVYGAWSFRALDEARRTRFFTARGKEWEVAPDLRERVRFASNNLFADPFPTRDGDLQEIDLIVCRNVFIYFDREGVATVLRKFGATLRTGGFLVCGHAELHDVPLGALEARAFPQSVIYERAAPPKSPATATRIRSASTNAVRPAPYSGEQVPERFTTPPASRPLTARPTASPALQKAPSTPPVSSTSPVSASPTALSVPAAPLLRSVVTDPTSMTNSPIAANAPIASNARSTSGALKINSSAAALERAATLIRGGQPAAGVEMVESLLEREPGFLAAWCFLAQAQADAGELDRAQKSCQRALEVSPMAALPYLLQARIAEERGAGESAKALLKKVMYLNPRSICAPLELSAIYRREGEEQRAAQMLRAALRLLEGLPDEAEVPAEEHALETPHRAGELKRQLRAALGDNGVQKS